MVQFSCGYQSLPIDHPLGCTGPQSHAAPFEGVGEQLGVSATILARWFEQDKLFGPGKGFLNVDRGLAADQVGISRAHVGDLHASRFHVFLVQRELIRLSNLRLGD